MNESNQSSPLVSVIMPAYETSKFVTEAIESVRAQTMGNFELLLVDDCSSDDTVQVARRAAQQDPRIIIIELDENGGAAKARNIAIDRARGRFIAFLDSDDLWYPEKLERQIAFMHESDAAFSYTQYDVISEEGAKVKSLPVPERITYRDLLRCCPIGCMSTVYDREKLGTIYMSSMRKRQDWATWLKIVGKSGEGRGLNVPLGAYRLREGSLSFNKFKVLGAIWSLYRHEQGFGRAASAFYMSIYCLNGALRRYIPGFSSTVGYI